MIHEGICTYEVAKLANEKGFPQWFNYTRFKFKWDYYNHKGEFNGDVGDILKLRIKHKPVPEDMKPIAAPTQSLLQRWLREEKFIDIAIYPIFINGVRTYTCYVYAPNLNKPKKLKYFDTYELTIEDALKYVLKKIDLI